MKYGLSEEQLKVIEEALKSFSEIEQVILFGSRSIDTFREASDVDIAIKGKKADFNLASELKTYFEEKTNLPFFFDIISYSTIESKELKKHIRQKGKVIYTKGWREVKLGYVADIQNGYAFKSTDFSKDDGTIVIKIKNISSGGLNLDSKALYSKNIDHLESYKVQEGDTLIAMTGSHVTQPSSMLGRSIIYQLKNRALFNQRIGKIYVTKENKLLKFFLSYFLKQENIVFELASNASGSANQANISSSSIKSLTISLPPLPEQKAIAEILSSLDDKIELLHCQNKTLENMEQILCQKWWFIDDLSDSSVLVQKRDLDLMSMNKKIEPIFEKIILNFKKILALENLRDILLPKLMNGSIRIRDL